MDGPFIAAAVIDQAVVNNDRTCDTDIDAELHRDFDDMIAMRLHLGREAAFFGPQDISRRRWMRENGQIDGVIGQFHADQLAPFRQPHVTDRIEMIDGHRADAARRVALFQLMPIPYRADEEKETAAERMGGAQQIARIHKLAAAFDPDAEITAL